MKNECCNKMKKRSEEEKRLLINRLSRIEGQIRGLRAMVEKDAYCPDILDQAAAVSAAIGAFNGKLLENHVKSCVIDGIRAGDDAVTDELMETLKKLMK